MKIDPKRRSMLGRYLGTRQRPKRTWLAIYSGPMPLTADEPLDLRHRLLAKGRTGATVNVVDGVQFRPFNLAALADGVPTFFRLLGEFGRPIVQGTAGRGAELEIRNRYDGKIIASPYHWVSIDSLVVKVVP